MLFYVNFGFNVNTFKNINKEGLNNIKAILTLKQLKKLHKNIKKKLKLVKQKINKYYNQKRLKGLIFSKRSIVYLAIKNIITKRLNKKLNYKYIKLYKIIKKILKNNY